jgi:nucleoside-diphosphate-sugar epimerase
MRIFVTGGSGYVGSAVVDELVRAGHAVTGLARSPAAAERLEELGARPVEGELGHPHAWAPAAAGSDAVVHLAQDGGAADRRAADRAVLHALVRAAGPALRTFVYTSNAFILGDQGPGLLGEDDALPGEPSWGAWRLDAERDVLAAATPSLATAVIRPGQVYGGDGGTLPLIWESAADQGAAMQVGDGANRWSMVERGDLARLYRRVVETAARGVFHGVDGAPLTVAELTRLASQAAGADGRTQVVPLDDARRDWGGFADMLALDVGVVPVRARALGWEPAWPSFAAAAGPAFREWEAVRAVR